MKFWRDLPIGLRNTVPKSLPCTPRSIANLGFFSLADVQARSSLGKLHTLLQSNQAAVGHRIRASAGNNAPVAAIVHSECEHPVDGPRGQKRLHESSRQTARRDTGSLHPFRKDAPIRKPYARGSSAGLDCTEDDDEAIEVMQRESARRQSTT